MSGEQNTGTTRSASAPRVKRPTWKDPRLALGAVLVVASVVGTVYLVRELNHTTEVYVAGANITLGEELSTQNLRTENVKLGESGVQYLEANPELITNARANTFIGAGEFIPNDSITHNELGSRRPINIDLPADLTPAITPGSFVDVWIAQREKGGSAYGVPEQLASMVEVSARVARAGGLVNQNGTNLELLVEPDHLEPLLQALANESRIIVIYNPAGTQQ
ncbi:hypothetical protein ACT3UQ_10290 [Glutamicibacter sp. AOP12-B1-11]|uniref:hypothetical protein n=1 Tax=Glutamicibacter sp. AOP12-B1-11 TaxID=3457725 RepID=UPI0011B02521